MKKFLPAVTFFALLILAIPLIVSAKHIPPFFAKSSKNISLICESRCPFAKKKLVKAFFALDRQFAEMEEKIQTPFPENLKPVEIHLRYDRTCRRTSQTRTTDPEVFGFTSTKPNGKGIICIKADIDDIIQNRPTHLLHEYAHHYFPIKTHGKQDFEEILVAAFEQFITGKPGSFCALANKKSEQSLYRLCRDFGFETDDIPELMLRLQEIAKTEKIVTNAMALVEIQNLFISRPD